MGLEAIQWNVDLNDWKWGLQSGQLVTNLRNALHKGPKHSIILQHDLRHESVREQNDIIKFLKAANIRIISLSKCVGNSAYL